MKQEKKLNLMIKPNIRGNGWVIKSMGMAHKYGLMGLCIKDIGKIINNMEKVYL